MESFKGCVRGNKKLLNVKALTFRTRRSGIIATKYAERLDWYQWPNCFKLFLSLNENKSLIIWNPNTLCQKYYPLIYGHHLIWKKNIFKITVKKKCFFVSHYWCSWTTSPSRRTCKASTNIFLWTHHHMALKGRIQKNI